MLENTLSIIKPDGTQRNLVGKILTYFEEKNLQISAMKMKKLTLKEAQGFYIEHKDRPFYDELVRYMISAPVVLMVLSGDNAINKNREIMGATNPEEAAEGTIRKSFAKNIGENTVHGSDSQKSAKREIDYFFSESEITN
jgi:nucleoside-diphosphate kinase